jgi:hypothetical protein
MLRWKFFSVALLIAIFLVLASGFIFIPDAEAVTVEFQWHGTTGYFAKGSFSYDEKTTPQIISEKGSGKTKDLNSLVVSFYDPSGKPIAKYENATAGIAKGNYFEFNFDTVTQQLIGQIDLGGEFSGETYLKGTVDKNLSLFTVEKSGSERILDEDFGAIARVISIHFKTATNSKRS